MRVFSIVVLSFAFCACAYGSPQLKSVDVEPQSPPARLDAEAARAKIAALKTKLGSSNSSAFTQDDADDDLFCETFNTKIRAGPRPQIWDTFIFNNELDMLEVRLFELYPVVDRIVLVEATRTHSNLPKELHFAENAERFEHYLDKIEYVVVDDLPVVEAQNGDTEAHWQRERHHRAAISRGLSSGGARPTDLIIVSDVDEIPFRDVVLALRHCETGLTENAFIELHSVFFYYSLDWLWVQSPDENTTTPSLWEYGPKVATYEWIQLRSPAIVRHGAGPDTAKLIWRMYAWHFSYFGGTEMIKRKIASYAHQENNRGEVTAESHVADCLSKGKDLFGRKTMKGYGRQWLERVSVQNVDGVWDLESTPVPEIFKAHPERLLEFRWVVADDPPKTLT